MSFRFIDYSLLEIYDNDETYGFLFLSERNEVARSKSYCLILCMYTVLQLYTVNLLRI